MTRTQDLSSYLREPDFDDIEPDFSDDRVLACPECETPNQFGELCQRCQRDLEAEE